MPIFARSGIEPSQQFLQPGTRFLLQVVSTCEVPQPLIPGTTTPVPGTVQHTQLHVDSWRWRVVANEHTLLNVINLMHTGAISTLEVPCILGEDMYDALVKAQGTLAGAINPGPNVPKDITSVGNAIFDMEALIVANCLFVEVLNPLVAFPGPDQFGAPNIQLPGNLAETVIFGTQGSAVAGIIDTVEHPCCCKLLVDLEWISIRNGLVAGIIGHDMILPTF